MRNKSIRFFVKVPKKGKCVQILFHTYLMDEQEGHRVAPHEDSIQIYQSRKWWTKSPPRPIACKSWGLKQHWSLFLMWYTKNSCTKEKQGTMNSMVRCWQGCGTRFQEWDYNVERKAVDSFYMTTYEHILTSYSLVTIPAPYLSSVFYFSSDPSNKGNML